MYVTTANQCFALDAGSGRQIWRYRRDLPSGLTTVRCEANGLVDEGPVPIQ